MRGAVLVKAGAVVAEEASRMLELSERNLHPAMKVLTVAVAANLCLEGRPDLT